MKKILLLLLILSGLFSCENFDKVHPDFDYTAGYFPYQFPVRTLVLGDYIYDNSNDNNQKFIISVAMGGVYENSKNRVFNIQVDESLCDNILFNTDGDLVRALPSSYYTLSSISQIVIPKGKLNGGIEVQLNDAFFNDPLAITLGYVVPIRLTGSNDVDTLLVGKSDNPNADPRDASQWITPPKNFTMFGIKYINEYHGNYFHYGQSSVKDNGNNTVENKTYNAAYVENNPIARLNTTARRQVSFKTFLRSDVMSLGEVELLLTFNGNNCTITAAPGVNYTVSGTGEFKSKAYSWGNKDRDGIVLNFTLTNGIHTYQASDILVIRDRAVVMETYSPELIN
jgi:hypothetical protein